MAVIASSFDGSPNDSGAPSSRRGKGPPSSCKGSCAIKEVSWVGTRVCWVAPRGSPELFAV
jgi:hypothetical protein